MAFLRFFRKKGEDAISFLDDLEIAFLVIGRDDDATKVRVFPLVLKDGARVWYQGLLAATRGTWEDLKVAFLQKYQDTEPPEDLWKKIQDLHQDSLMEYRSYEDMFVKLWDRRGIVHTGGDAQVLHKSTLWIRVGRF